MEKLPYKIALRSLVKHKVSTLINISGLAIGIACSILIFLFVKKEYSYDRFHKNANRIYRLAVRASIGDTKINQTNSSAITFQKLLEDFAEIENGVRLFQNSVTKVSIGDRSFYESRIIFSDSSFFEIFSFNIVKGDRRSLLTDPNTIVITRSTALKYFGTDDVLGRTIRMDFSPFGEDSKRVYVIRGVSEDVPDNSHFHYDIIVSLMSFPDRINNTGWTNNNYQSYLLLREGTRAEDLEIKLKDFTRKYMGEEDFDKWVAKGNSWVYFLQPLTSIHLHSDLNGEFEANGNGTYVDIFSVTCLLVLLIAILNFVNLSTARSSLRAKEVGIKKIVGSGRKSLIFQFMSEAIFTSFIALVLALIIVHSILPAYSEMVEQPLGINYFDNLYIIPGLLGLALIVGTLSGIYPSFLLSSYRPIGMIKSFTKMHESHRLRNILVVFQLCLSIFLIICAITINQQLHFLLNKKLGFDKQQVLIVHNPGILTNNVDVFKNEVLRNSSVASVSVSNFLPSYEFSNIGFGAEGIEDFTLNIGMCDYDYARTLKLEMERGRFLSPDFPSDSNAVVINEKAAQILGWDEPIGKVIHNWNRNRGYFTVVGVVKDFNYESLHQEVRPMALFLEGGYYKRTQSNISVRLNTNDVANTIDYIQHKWKELAPGTPFNYSFLDQDYDRLYSDETQTEKIFTIFSGLSIFIACLGLLGLASFIAERKTREIAIRKVLGASVIGMVRMQNKGFMGWVLIASLLAWPLAWYALNLWLHGFAFKIQLSVVPFIGSTLLVLFIALLVASSQTIKSAFKNPVDSLYYE